MASNHSSEAAHPAGTTPVPADNQVWNCEFLHAELREHRHKTCNTQFAHFKHLSEHYKRRHKGQFEQKLLGAWGEFRKLTKSRRIAGPEKLRRMGKLISKIFLPGQGQNHDQNIDPSLLSGAHYQ